MDTNARRFQDPRSDDEAVIHALAQMSASGVPAALLTRVANDPSYRPFHRAAAVHELFKRHVERLATLRELASILAGGNWLVDAVIEKIESMGGEIPLEVPIAGAAFVIRLPREPEAVYPEVGVYLALDRPLDVTMLRDALMSRATDPSVGRIRIVDFALFPENLVANSRQ